MLNKWNHDVSQKCWLNKLLMKKFQKPLALELKHFTQRKWVNFYWNKMEELFIGKLNSPCFQFQIEYTPQTNCLLQQWLKLYTAIKKSTKTQLKRSPHEYPFSHGTDTGTPWHTAFRRQDPTANLTMMPTLQKAREVTKLLSIFPFPLAMHHLVHLLKHFSSLLKYKTSGFLSSSRYEG